MPKKFLLLLSLIVIILTAYFTLLFNSGLQQPLPKNEVDTAINQAKHLYNLEKQAGRDFSTGPCLSEVLLPGWVLDIVHSPRLPIDDLPSNQCLNYREGKASHFVELDTNGNLIRAQ